MAMKPAVVVALFLVVLGIAHSQLVTDTGGNISLNAYVDCDAKEVVFETDHEGGLAVLMYGDLLIDKTTNISSGRLGFYGKLNLITIPFTLRIESGEEHRIIEFYIDECKEGASNISLASEIEPEPVEEVETPEPEEEHEPAKPKEVENTTTEEVEVNITVKERKGIFEGILDAISSFIQGLLGLI